METNNTLYYTKGKGKKKYISYPYNLLKILYLHDSNDLELFYNHYKNSGHTIEELIETIDKFIYEALPENEAHHMILRYKHGKSIREIAEIAGTTYGKIRTRVDYANLHILRKTYNYRKFKDTFESYRYVCEQRELQVNLEREKNKQEKILIENKVRDILYNFSKDIKGIILYFEITYDKKIYIYTNKFDELLAKKGENGTLEDEINSVIKAELIDVCSIKKDFLIVNI